MPRRMNKTGDAQNPRWQRAFQSREHHRDIMWTHLVEEIAREHFKEVTSDPSSRTRTQRQMEDLRRGVYDTGACMVAVLFVPSNSGAYFFVSTVPKHFQTDMRRDGYLDAPAWWAAVNRKSNVYCHAEDGVEYDFEMAFRSNSLRDVAHIQLVQDGRTQYYDVQDRDTEFSRLKLGVWGCYGDESPEEQKEGHFVELCNQSPNKSPSCRDVAATLNIDYCTRAKLEREKAEIAASSQRYKSATGGGQGGGRGGGAGPSSGHHSSHGHSGPSSGPQSYLPPGNIRPSASGASRDPRGPDVSQLSGKMSSLNVRREPERRERREPERRERREPERREARREPERREKPRREVAHKDEYWTWDERRREFYHVHSDGAVSYSRSGR